MVEESQETLFLSEHSAASSDHVVLSPSVVAEAQTQHERAFRYGSEEHQEDGGPLSMRMTRPSAIMREWFDDIHRRGRVLMAPLTRTSLGNTYSHEPYDDEYCLVQASDSLQSDHVRLDDSHEVDGLEVSMMVDIHSDPMVELMLENRINRLEADLEACEIEYEKRIRSLEYELQQKTLEQSTDNMVYQSRIKELEFQNLLLKQENESLRISNEDLRAQTAMALGTVQRFEQMAAEASNSRSSKPHFQGTGTEQNISKLTTDQIMRYSRQLLLQDGFGIKGQCILLSSSVLVIGAGGIGSTVLMYLAASGLGHISVVDFDAVDKSNLHRQVIHNEANEGVNKAVSACQMMRALNPTIHCTPIEEILSFDNALDLVSRHDCVVDASDNPQTRYLINDACVLANKPLVSGSAMGTEGQLSVYNHAGGPCYRCMYPKPNSAEGCKTCSDNGVLGPVPGLIGILQSLEVIKVLTGIGTTMHDRMLMYDSLQCSFTNIKKPPKSNSCAACSGTASIQSMADSKVLSLEIRGPAGSTRGSVEGAARCSPSIVDALSISCSDYCTLRNNCVPHVLIDVRAKRQFEMCSLDGAVNIPLEELRSHLVRASVPFDKNLPIFCICRRGIYSVEATKMILDAMKDLGATVSIKNISGGLAAWTDEVDPSFPKY